jgi:hypothetical protein
MAYVILLHFDQPVNPDYPARHYLEYAVNIRKRLADHTSGDRTRTSGIMFACYERSIGFTVARIWQDATRRDEYRLRQLANNPKLCPICNPALALRTAYDPRDHRTWLTTRLNNTSTLRYGDLETLPPYQYKPKHRKRSNGESNRASGSASTWRADTKAAAPPSTPAIDRLADRVAADIGAATDVPIEVARGWLAGALRDSIDYGFDADIPL